MARKLTYFLQVTIVAAVCIGAAFMQQALKIPKTSFTCDRRPMGYYADLETGCQVYHMCDGLGRQFSYSCPNTTLFQQRMLICDHWYMVNCSASERDYDVNLLIGQRDKPFVPDDEDHQRTPRPDILTVPYAENFNNYGNSNAQLARKPVSTKKKVDDTIANGNNDLSDGAVQFHIPTHWSTEFSRGNQYTTSRPKKSDFTGRPIIVTNAGPDNFDNNHDNQGFQQNSNNESNAGTTKNKPNSQAQNTKRNNNFQKTATGPVQNTGSSTISKTVEKPGFSTNVGSNNPSQSGIKNSQNGGKFLNNGFTQTASNNEGINRPSKFFQVPADQQVNSAKRPSSTTVRSIASFNNQLLHGNTNNPNNNEDDKPFQIDIRFDKGSKDYQDDEAPVNFIKRFNPNQDINNSEGQNQPSVNFPVKNEQNPQPGGFEIQSSSETAGFATQVNNNQISNTANKQSPPESTDTKLDSEQDNIPNQLIPASDDKVNSNVPLPARDFLPPKTEYSEISQTTMGPPIYYEWKWAAPAFDLDAPTPFVEKKQTKDLVVNKEGRPDFALPRSTTERAIIQITERSSSDHSTDNLETNKNKYASYFVPDYVFPLDKQHPGYEEDGAITSFQVRIPHSVGDDNSEIHPYYGENAQCPHCHPSFVVPGTCKPCVMIRR